MRKLTYFAVFEPSETGYSVYFPDFPGCITVGDNIQHAVNMAKEALGFHFCEMEKDNEEIPNPTYPPFTEMESGDFAMPVEIFPDLAKNIMENRAVKKTLTIPSWLNDEAERAKINFSQLLQASLKEHLGITH